MIRTNEIALSSEAICEPGEGAASHRTATAQQLAHTATRRIDPAFIHVVDYFFSSEVIILELFSDTDSTNLK